MTGKARYELLILKSELCELNAQAAQTNWAWQYWQGVADKLKEMALSMNLEELA